jgi:hypothetical protein
VDRDVEAQKRNLDVEAEIRVYRFSQEAGISLNQFDEQQ